MVEFSSLPERVAHKGMALIAGVVCLAALVGYAFHEHRTAQDLAAQNAQQATDAHRDPASDWRPLRQGEYAGCAE